MSVKVFDPRISLNLKKNIGRASVSGSVGVSQRFSGSPRTLDLTPWLGEQGGVVVRKSVRDPAGMFTITLADRFDADTQDTLYAKVEPLDAIDIRMARDTSLYAGLTDSMPMMMRGLVTSVSRAEIMTNAGPERAVVIRGQDYGKLLLMCRIAYLNNGVLGQDLLTFFKLFVNFGIDVDAFQDASQFVSGIINGPVAKLISDMRDQVGQGGNQSPIENLVVDATVQNASVSPFGTNEWPGGTVYDLLSYFGDLPVFNEGFVEDREDAPYFVYRPNPFKDPSGNFIQQMTKPPAIVEVTDEHVVSLEVGRSDDGVFCYYWVDAPSYLMNDGGIYAASITPEQDPNLYLHDYDNSTDRLYGFRILQATSQQGPRYDGNSKAKYEGAQQTTLEFIASKRAVLSKTNRDNVVFETGTAELRGLETVKAGTILKVTRGQGMAGALTSEYYVPTVTHSYRPFQSYRTTVELERGTGFITRVQRDGGSSSPYLTELSAAGVYS